MADGELSIEEGALIAGMIEVHRKAIETTEIAEDVREIKRRLEIK